MPLVGTYWGGTWFDRKLEHNARLRGKEPEPREFASPEEVVQAPIGGGAYHLLAGQKAQGRVSTPHRDSQLSPKGLPRRPRDRQS